MKRIFRAVRLGICLTASGLIPFLLTGCGGGSGSSSSGSPSAGTRAAVRKVQSHGLRAFANGAPAASTFGASVGGGVGGNAAGASTTSTGTSGIPLVGGYLNSLNAAHTNHRAAKHRTRDEDPNFYYDEWLGLWVEINNTSTTYSQQFYTDQAKTQSAGRVESVFSASDAVPQTSTYTYTFTAGIMAGTHGSSSWSSNADGSGASSYENVTADGWKFKGSSVQQADGTSVWKNRTDEPDGFFTTDEGTFKADGSSVTKTVSSDGYTAQFTNNADGSATGIITGPNPGLPAHITRDTTGKTVIRYADGTIETIPGWTELYNDTVGAVSGSSGSEGTTTGSGGSSGNTGGGSPPIGL